MDKVLITIAARGGSKGVKNKNIRSLCGKPLIAYTILQAKKWGKAARIICSTDSDDIAKKAQEYGAEVLFKRPKALAGDRIGKLEVIRHALLATEEITKKEFSIVIDLDATAPLRKISDIEGAYQKFIAAKPKTVFSVVPSRRNPYFNMVEMESDGFAKISKRLPDAVKCRQDAPKVYDMNASIYVYDREYLSDKNTKTAISDKSLVWVMDEISAFDIDSELDFQLVEFIVRTGLAPI